MRALQSPLDECTGVIEGLTSAEFFASLRGSMVEDLVYGGIVDERLRLAVEKACVRTAEEARSGSRLRTRGACVSRSEEVEVVLCWRFHALLTFSLLHFLSLIEDFVCCRKVQRFRSRFDVCRDGCIVDEAEVALPSDHFDRLG